jgi:hypothetical protein
MDLSALVRPFALIESIVDESRSEIRWITIHTTDIMKTLL